MLLENRAPAAQAVSRFGGLFGRGAHRLMLTRRADR
jgi:hypothetical protein